MCGALLLITPRDAEAQWAQQQTGITARMPTGGRPVSRQSGLTLTIDTRWAPNYGYRPIKVTVQSPKPTTSDHLIIVRLYSGWWWGMEQGQMSVEQDFELVTGSTSVTETISCPQYQLAAQCFWWDVWVDGVKDRDLSMKKETALTKFGNFGMATQRGKTFLAVGLSGQERVLTANGTGDFSILSLTVPEFPRRWLDYTCFDVVTLSLTDLEQLVKMNPEAFVALGRWTRAGGQLWVSGAGGAWEKLPVVSKILGLAEKIVQTPETRDSKPREKTSSGKEDESKEITNDEAIVDEGWRAVQFGRGGRWNRAVTFMNRNTGLNRVERDPETIAQLRDDPNYSVTMQEAIPDDEQEENDEPRRPFDSRLWFLDQQMGLGVVRAFRSMYGGLQTPALDINATVDPAVYGVDPATAAKGATIVGNSDSMSQSQTLSTAHERALRRTRRWERRHGMTPDSANRDFAELLVPGVGLAPVTAFRILITLFVLLIGPVNYWVLKRAKRLHLLVLTVPLAAGLMTAALFAYAILSDGFGTAARVHSLTLLDQRTGEAACWSRLSYYSGLAPGSGLTIPSDAAIYPIVPDWNDGDINDSVGADREMIWEPEEAKLTRGWLRSRTPTQYLTIRARQSPYRLKLTPAADKLRAVNELNTAIEYVVAVDKNGQLYAGERIPDDSSTNLMPTKRADASSRVRKLMSENAPQMPEALAKEGSDFMIQQQRQTLRMMRSQYGLDYSTVALKDNLMSEVLENLAGQDGEPALQLPPQSYVAFTQTSPEAPLATASAEEVASFHVLIGRW
jgi:hypothetical protein